ncbi:MAG: HAMP domain-containing histidine kinase [Candidatus Aminicenantes bacterium]|nr:HAMP domain-containing histidine kinase [Candidatus Aminicenantes bacterium]
MEEDNVKIEEVEPMLALDEKLVFLRNISSEISHEINNPLFAISNSYQLIKKYLPTDNERVTQAAGVLDRELKRFRNLTRNLFSFTLNAVEEPAQADLIALVGAAVEVLDSSNSLGKTEVDFKGRGLSFPLYCRPGSLQQVFINLLKNSAAAMAGKSKGKVVIEAAEEEQDYRIDVIDNGPGIPGSIKAQVFLPVWEHGSGKIVGVGLYISFNIITNHGGTITLDGSSKQGAHFIIKIPKADQGGPKNG